jgi:hypothetical protein
MSLATPNSQRGYITHVPNLPAITLTRTLSLKKGEGLIRKRAVPSCHSCLLVKRTMCKGQYPNGVLKRSYSVNLPL